MKLKYFLIGMSCGVVVGATGGAVFRAQFVNPAYEHAIALAAINLGWECAASKITAEGCRLIASTAWVAPAWKPNAAVRTDVPPPEAPECDAGKAPVMINSNYGNAGWMCLEIPH